MTDLADTLDRLAEWLVTESLRLRAQERPGAAPAAEPTPDTPDLRTDRPQALSAPSFDDLPPEEWDSGTIETEPAISGGWPLPSKPAGSAAVCPAHGIAFLHGKNRTMFCPARSDDPAWSNPKGYCRITPKSAAAWLRQHA